MSIGKVLSLNLLSLNGLSKCHRRVGRWFGIAFHLSILQLRDRHQLRKLSTDKNEKSKTESKRKKEREKENENSKE